MVDKVPSRAFRLIWGREACLLVLKLNEFDEGETVRKCSELRHNIGDYQPTTAWPKLQAFGA
jgi:hypothetical protein